MTVSSKRNYRKEYDNYHSKPAQRKDRSKRTLAARKMPRVAGKDVHHKDGNPRNNSRSNLTMVSRASNRNKSPGRPTGKRDTYKRIRGRG